MPFVQGKCESCGGILTVDPSLKAANCPFCGVAYVVQDSINYYNTTIKVETMHADVVNVSDESSAEGRLRAAEAFMKLGKYLEAEKEYKRVTDLTPQNYLGWLGLIESRTHNYSLRIKSLRELNRLKDYAKSFLVFAPKDSSENLIDRYNAYIKSEEEKNMAECAPYFESIHKHKEELTQLDEQIKTLKLLLGEKTDSLYVLSNKVKLNEEREERTRMQSNLLIIGIAFIVISGLGLTFKNMTVFWIFTLLSGLPFMFYFMKRSKMLNYKKQLALLKDELSDLESESYDLQKQKDSISNMMISAKSFLEQYN